MRLTAVGKDYFTAVVLVTILGMATSSVTFVILGLSLSFAGVISLLLLRLYRERAMLAVPQEASLRVFKGESAHTSLRLRGAPTSWAAVSLGSLLVRGPVEVKSDLLPGGGYALSLRPTAAGRFGDLAFSARLSDPLRLFVHSEIVVPVALTLDSMPLSLLERPRTPLISPLTLGERPSGTPGKGQEFFGVGEYVYGSESRDILWKRVARSPELNLLVRQRESNIPETASLALVLGWLRGEDRTKLVDMMCEGLGSLGTTLLGLGMRVTLKGEDLVTTATSSDELVEAIMVASTLASSSAPEDAAECDVVVEVGGMEGMVRPWAGFKPTVSIGDRDSALPRFAVGYTGVEDLATIAGAVLEK
jgi:uncharacterized protein (DUF58 family)